MDDCSARPRLFGADGSGARGSKRGRTDSRPLRDRPAARKKAHHAGSDSGFDAALTRGYARCPIANVWGPWGKIPLTCGFE